MSEAKYKTIKLTVDILDEIIKNDNLTHYLTVLDPDEFYVDTTLAGLDAFERQLYRFDIRVSESENKSTASLNKFFKSEHTIVLLWEYIRRRFIRYFIEYCENIQLHYVDVLPYIKFNWEYNSSNDLVLTKVDSILCNTTLNIQNYRFYINFNALNAPITYLNNIINTAAESISHRTVSFYHSENKLKSYNSSNLFFLTYTVKPYISRLEDQYFFDIVVNYQI